MPQQLRAPAWRYPEYILRALQNAGFEERDYQKVAVSGVVSLLQRGKAAEVDLPPGTGKTLVGHIVAWMWVHDLGSARNRVLILVPSTILLEQHSRVFQQWVPYSQCPSIEWSSEWLSSRRVWHAQQAENARVFFALPQALAGSIRSGRMPQSVWSTIRLVIIDEYDAFSLGAIAAESLDPQQASIHLKLSLSSLVNSLQETSRVYFRLSATPIATTAPTGTPGILLHDKTARKLRLHR